MSGLAEDDILEVPWKRHARRAGMVALLVAVVAGVVLLVQQLGGEAKTPARQVTKIVIVPDTPPPPPPPPKEQPKPEPQKEASRPLEQPKAVDQPKPQEAEQLKMEGEAGDGPSPFAAGQVTKDYIGGEVGSGNGLQFTFYSRLIQRHLQTALARRPEIKRLDYRVKVTVWLGADGGITRARLDDSTGNAEMDALLRTALLDLPPLPESPPEKLPQPITVRITNRVTG